MVILLLTLLISQHIYTNGDVETQYHITPSIPQNDSSFLNDGYSLDEWIESGKNDNVTSLSLVLLPGIHLVNTTRERLLLENIDKLTITGFQEKAIISCYHWFKFELVNVTDVIMSNIKIQLLNHDDSMGFILQISCSRNLTIRGMTLIPGRIVIHQCKHLSSFSILSNLYILSGGIEIYNHPAEYNLTCLAVKLINSKLLNSSILIKSQRLCTEVCVQEVVMTEFIHQAFSILSISSATKVLFYDLIVQNSSSSMLYVKANIIELKGHCLFSWNISTDKYYLSGVYFEPEKILLIHSNSKIEFTDNHIIHGSVLYIPQNVQPDISINNSEISFENNIVHEGGIMIVNGLGMMQVLDSQINFVNNSCQQLSIMKCNGGVSFISYNTYIAFRNNQVKHGGVMIFQKTERIEMYTSKIIFENNACLDSSTRSADDAILLFLNSYVTFHQSDFKFHNNTAPTTGGLTLIDTSIYTKCEVNADFEYNSGTDGGALSFYEESRIIPHDNSYFVLHFYGNRASSRGGAIFVDDSGYFLNRFTQDIYPPFIFSYEIYEMQAHFSNDVAENSGDEVFGGWIDRVQNAENLFNFSGNNMHNMVASNPTRICMCVNSSQACNITEYTEYVYPGQMFAIEAVAIGQRFGIVPSLVTVITGNGDRILDVGQYTQSIGRQCRALYFTVSTARKLETLNLTTQEFRTPCKFLNAHAVFQLLCERFSMKVKLKDCPLGFVFNTSIKKCQCSSQISSHTKVSCDFETYNIVKGKQVWLLSQNSSGKYQIVIHDNCPYDYCRGENNSLSFKLEFPDDQCAFNRSGILCGACQETFSQVLGTSRCRKCSNIYLIIVIPCIILVGLLLVWFLMFFDLTISVGTINGLIFYVNIIRITKNVFFPPEMTSSFSSVFIAWFNLDLGIEICFYNGLDLYAKTWLLLVFPLYVWLSVCIAIVASRYSVAISRILTPNNQLHVLATLFLLSYTKILQVITTVFSYTVLQYSDDLSKTVWFYDGNTEFLTGKHIPLFIACLLLLTLLIIPFTLSLISIQILQVISKFRRMFWVQSLIPFFDCYSKPYKSKHCYWIGVQLLIRVIVLVTTALNVNNRPAINLIAVSVTTIILLVYASYVGVYKHWLHNALEIALLFNLAILSIIILYTLLTNGNIALITSTSISITFILFVMIVIYHVIQKIMSMRKFRDLKTRITENVFQIRGNGCSEQHKNLNSDHTTKNEVTHTDICLQELIMGKETECDASQ